jgi:molybdopterin synthase catalytic subunit
LIRAHFEYLLLWDRDRGSPKSSDHLLPMANPVCEVLVTEAELHSVAEQPNPAAGAVIDFWGLVRLQEGEQEIDGLDYEAHGSMAEHQLGAIGREAIEQFGLKVVIIHHRVGFVPVGKASLFARVAAPHRAEAIRGVEWLVDELKKRVPIWKKPRFKVDQSGGRISAMKEQAITRQ